jgi:hypothetical protein
MYTDCPIILQFTEQARKIVNALDLHSRGTRLEEMKKHKVTRKKRKGSRRIKKQVKGEK